jgi:hypothetical protein
MNDDAGCITQDYKFEQTLTFLISIENLYEESSESGSGWIQWFCDLEGHEFFIEVDEDYIRDNFNLHGLRERVTYFK